MQFKSDKNRRKFFEITSEKFGLLADRLLRKMYPMKTIKLSPAKFVVSSDNGIHQRDLTTFELGY
jgi:hypothetical protein